jgi:hypothetical protein
MVDRLFSMPVLRISTFSSAAEDLTHRLIAAGYPRAADHIDCVIRTFWPTWPEAYADVMLSLLSVRETLLPDELELLGRLDATIGLVTGYFEAIGHSA